MKKIAGYIKLQVPAGAATPAPPIGPALGQRGLNIMEFCKAFNARTAELEKNVPLPVTITHFADHSFTFSFTKPPVSYLLKRLANLKAGSKTPGRESCGKITMTQVIQIAEEKRDDLNAVDQAGAVQMIKGSARSMGLEVVEE